MCTSCPPTSPLFIPLPTHQRRIVRALRVVNANIVYFTLHTALQDVVRDRDSVRVYARLAAVVLEPNTVLVRGPFSFTSFHKSNAMFSCRKCEVNISLHMSEQF